MSSFFSLKGLIGVVLLHFFLVASGCSVKTASAPPPPPPPPSEPLYYKIAMPDFEWPPPKASAVKVIPDEFLRRSGKDSLLFRDVDHILSSALDQCGYSECSYYAVPGGFAVVTRIEQINSDGTPKRGDSRWSVKTPPISPFSDFPQYLEVLFKGNPGYYRVIVFIFTPYGFTQGAKGPSREAVEGWFSKGFNVLPVEEGKLLYTKDHRCTAMIYEFKKISKQAIQIIPGRLTGKAHLERSRVWLLLQL
ncbi:hypothetical protein Cpha266_1558 [Chlorobium phaeobacteroides DSM 266]|uniref:Uncharacterized protein n=2 Tax=Chlorobium phaeobacteroides TaxID=1096 RepID=A1BGQ3_CHLPD|nr:hypothetical protein Cpha266_1558 [Chlorobium phaeobacteroides DSM 266]